MRHGFLLVRKPKGPTSHDTVGQVRRLLSEPHIGHLGTLDPMAEGLLVLAVGTKALKVIELFMSLPKEYDAEVTMGAESTTYDGEGMITKRKTSGGWVPPEDVSMMQKVLNERFIGTVSQVPPVYSALKIGGTRAYRKAQQGESVEMKARDVRITECKILSYSYPILKLHVACGSGTYIRSLAHDIGETFRSGAYLSALIRTKVGEWSVDNSLEPDKVAWGNVMPLKEVLASLAQRELTETEWKELQFGRSIEGVIANSLPLIGWYDGLPVAILEKNPKKEGMLKPRKVL